MINQHSGRNNPYTPAYSGFPSLTLGNDTGEPSSARGAPQALSVSEIEIKRLGPERWQDYRALRLEALKESSIAFGSSYEEVALLPEGDWKSRMKDALFAVDGNKTVGVLFLVFNQRAKTKHLAEIFGFYVNKGYQGRGVGNKLMDVALAEAKSRADIVKIRLSVNPEQKTALRLYRKHGFKIIGSLKKELLINGLFYDEVIMEKFL